MAKFPHILFEKLEVRIGWVSEAANQVILIQVHLLQENDKGRAVLILALIGGHDDGLHDKTAISLLASKNPITVSGGMVNGR